MPWFVKIERGIVNKPQFDRHVAAHVAYVKGLISAGHEARSGYWQERGGGMLIFKAASMADAKEIVAADPLVANDCVAYELHEWCLVADGRSPSLAQEG